MSESATSGDPLPILPKPSLPVWSTRAIAALAGVICFLMLPPWLGAVVRFVAAWDLAVFILIFEGWFLILRSDPERARNRAVAEGPGRAAILAISFGVSVISLLAAVVVIGQDQSPTPGVPPWLPTPLALAAIIGAWTLLHTAFTLHYARLYYADPDTAGSLEFRDGPPDDADFAYFAFGVGMTFQPPDVVVVTGQMRRIVLVHEVISFAFNTAILALVINLIAGHL